jgi:hypothetical protein
MPTSTSDTVYRVTITNLSDGQPLSPPILVTHSTAADVFTVGESSSASVQAIAENGDNSILSSSLASNAEVGAMVEASAPLVPADDPGGSGFSDTVTLEISARADTQYLSAAMMLICTNDGFTGLDTVDVPENIGDVLMYEGNAYDAGTEVNTEDFIDLVPPCQGLIGVMTEDEGSGMSQQQTIESGTINMHTGIVGDVDLQLDAHGFSNPIISIMIERIE